MDGFFVLIASQLIRLGSEIFFIDRLVRRVSPCFKLVNRYITVHAAYMWTELLPSYSTKFTLVADAA